MREGGREGGREEDNRNLVAQKKACLNDKVSDEPRGERGGGGKRG